MAMLIMPFSVFGLRCEHHKIGRIIVSFVAIYMMYHFAREKGSSEDLLSHDPMRMPTEGLGISFSFTGIETSLAKFLPCGLSHSARVQFFVHRRHTRAGEGLCTSP